MINRLILKSATEAKNEIAKKQYKEIAQLYKDWSKEVGQLAESYKVYAGEISILENMRLKYLEKQLEEMSKAVSQKVENKIKKNIYIVSDAVISANNEWLKELGLIKNSAEIALSSVPNEIVEKLVSGKIYKSGWSLSQRIWSDNNALLKDVYTIVAKGVAQNTSIYAIAKELEAYVSPNAKKQWNYIDRDGAILYKRQVDYNAQRLARTLIQHSYQQSVVEATEKNPFVKYYIWRANGSRVCPLCKSMDGNRYKKDELPLDHPNGMCTIDIDIDDNINDRLIKWVNAPTGTYKDIDNFASAIMR